MKIFRFMFYQESRDNGLPDDCYHNSVEVQIEARLEKSARNKAQKYRRQNYWDGYKILINGRWVD